MAEQPCVQFNDIFEEIPKGSSKDERQRIKERNVKNERLYKAVMHVLKQNFEFSAKLPDDPHAFATADLSDAERAQFIAILGIIQADNWDDPSNGKVRPSGDDVLVAGDKSEATFVIDRRFVDAVVEAVKEYTASSQLFGNVYQLMREEATKGLDKAPTGATA